MSCTNSTPVHILWLHDLHTKWSTTSQSWTPSDSTRKHELLKQLYTPRNYSTPLSFWEQDIHGFPISRIKNPYDGSTPLLIFENEWDLNDWKDTDMPQPLNYVGD